MLNIGKIDQNKITTHLGTSTKHKQVNTLYKLESRQKNHIKMERDTTMC